jgi:hypothetical protein
MWNFRAAYGYLWITARETLLATYVFLGPGN